MTEQWCMTHVPTTCCGILPGKLELIDNPCCRCNKLISPDTKFRQGYRIEWTDTTFSTETVGFCLTCIPIDSEMPLFGNIFDGLKLSVCLNKAIAMTAQEVLDLPDTFGQLELSSLKYPGKKLALSVLHQAFELINEVSHEYLGPGFRDTFCDRCGKKGSEYWCQYCFLALFCSHECCAKDHELGVASFHYGFCARYKAPQIAPVILLSETRVYYEK